MSKQNAVEDIYPLSASQQGMLFHLLFAEEKGQVYFDQYVSTLAGPLDVAAFRQAWSRALERHPALRTQFIWERREQPLQVVRRDADLPWLEHDWSHLPEAEREERLAAFLREDHDLGFDLGKPPLMRIAVIRWARRRPQARLELPPPGDGRLVHGPRARRRLRLLPGAARGPRGRAGAAAPLPRLHRLAAAPGPRQGGGLLAAHARRLRRPPTRCPSTAREPAAIPRAG